MATDAVVRANGLSKHFKDVKALTNFSIQIGRGEVVGLLGPNGSGKSTFVRLLLGFLTPTSGSASLLGFDCVKQRIEIHKRVAYLPGDARLFRTMRGHDVFRFFADMHGPDFVTRARKIASRLALDLKRWVAFMSTGMRQKLAISVVMAMDAPVIILDEPTSNLDPSVRSEVLALVKESQAGGKTVIFSSHVLSEIEDVCDRVVILRGGRLVHSQTLESDSDQYQVEFVFDSTSIDFPDSLANQWTDYDVRDRRHRFTFQGDMSKLLPWMSKIEVQKINIQPVSLRSIYDKYHQPDS